MQIAFAPIGRGSLEYVNPGWTLNLDEGRDLGVITPRLRARNFTRGKRHEL
jgi:hypothetical protein